MEDEVLVQGVESPTTDDLSVDENAAIRGEGAELPESPTGAGGEAPSVSSADTSLGEGGSITVQQPESPTGAGAELPESPTGDEKIYKTGSGRLIAAPTVEAIFSQRLGEVNRKHANEMRQAMQLLSDYEGDTIQEKLINKQAFEQNVAPEIIRQQIAQREAEVEAAVNNHPKVREAEALRFEKMQNEDFAAIKEAFPDIKANSLDDVIREYGGKFLDLRLRAGIDAVTALQAVIAQRAREQKPTPPTAGKIKSAVPVEKEFLTDDEIAAIPAEKLAKDDNLYNKVMKSLARKQKGMNE